METSFEIFVRIWVSINLCIPNVTSTLIHVSQFHWIGVHSFPLLVINSNSTFFLLVVVIHHIATVGLDASVSTLTNIIDKSYKLFIDPL